MTRSPDASLATDEKLSDYFICGNVRVIRSGAQYLQDLVVTSLDQAAHFEGAARSKLMAEVVDPYVLARVDESICNSLESISELFSLDYGQFKWCSDEIETIRLNWLEVVGRWPAATDTFEEQSRSLNHAVDVLDHIIYKCGALTLSPRVRETLNNLRVGQPLDWDFVFAGEMPRNQELRKRLLLELAQEGGVLANGVVDVDQGVIYKVAATRGKQIFSTWKLAGFVLLSGLIVPFALSRFGSLIDGWPHTPADLRKLILTYVLVFLGSGAHVAIDGLKTSRARTKPNFQAINDWILWLHVRYTRILFSLLWVLLGYILLSVLMPKLELVSAFFAGYSIDSITALFITRFEGMVAIKTQELTGDKGKVSGA